MEVIAIEDADWRDKQIELLKDLANPSDADPASN